MSATPQDVQAKLDAATAALKKTTSAYNAKKPGVNWTEALNDIAAARAEAGLLVSPTPPPPPPPPTGTILFDGRASQMSSMDSYQTDQAHSNIGPVVINGTTYYYNTTQQWIDPTHLPWDCVCYGRGIGHNFMIQPDTHYGKIFKITVKIGDTNQWGGNTGGTINGAAETSKRRTLHTDGWTWFAMATMVPSWNGNPSDIFFCELGSFGYQTSASSQVALDLNGDKGSLYYSIFSNAGYGNNPNGWARGSVAYNTPFLPVTFGQWEEFCIGVKSATDDTGEVQVYHRPQGGEWDTSPIFDFKGATEFYGVASGKTFPQNIEGQGVIDKMGMYYGLHSQTVVTQSVEQTGFVVCSDLATAQSVFQ